MNQKIIRIIGIVLLLFLLILVRKYQATLFYDPMLIFFKSNYHDLELPNYKAFQMYLHIMLRYTINGILSLGILYLWFQNLRIIKTSTLLIGIIGLLLLLLYIIFIETGLEFGYLTVFYIRRFLIQPMLLLFLIPAWYYFQTTNKTQK